MAAADYYLCDACGGKTFYDARLTYPYDLYEGQSVPEGITEGLPVGAGEMKVLCCECAKRHSIAIIKNDPEKLARLDGQKGTEE